MGASGRPTSFESGSPTSSPDVRIEALVDEVLAVLRSMEDLPYQGEPVSQLAHALQSGRRMQQRHRRDAAVLAATLHDVGRARGVVVRHEPHEVTAARWLHARFGPEVATLAGSHVAAKRVLVATDPTYVASLSSTSVATLRVQGGPATDLEVADFLSGPWSEVALDLRRADDAAKVSGGDELTLDEVADTVRRVASAQAKTDGAG